eukprot:2420614-Rhodomonas_salina.2
MKPESLEDEGVCLASEEEGRRKGGGREEEGRRKGGREDLAQPTLLGNADALVLLLSPFHRLPAPESEGEHFRAMTCFDQREGQS